MKIIKVLNNYRNDVWAIYECEHCGFNMQKLAYVDKNFNEKVIPRMKCPMCSKTAKDPIVKM